MIHFNNLFIEESSEFDLINSENEGLIKPMSPKEEHKELELSQEGGSFSNPPKMVRTLV